MLTIKNSVIVFLAACTLTVLAAGYGTVVIACKVQEALSAYELIPAKATNAIQFTQTEVAQTAGNLNRVMEDLDREPGQGKPPGTIQNVNMMIHNTGHSVTYFNIAARHYERQMSDWDIRGKQLYDDLHTNMIDMDTSIKSVKPLIDAGTATVKTANNSVGTLTPEMHRFLVAAADTTIQADGTATTVNKVTAKIAAPYLDTKPKHWYSYIRPTLEDLWKAAMLAK